MKHLFCFIFSLLLLASCSKDKTDDPVPKIPAEAIAGLYTMTAITSNGTTIALPFAANGVAISGTINVSVVTGKQDETNMTVTLKVTGMSDTSDSGLVQVKAASTGYELFENGQKLGTVVGNTLTITDGSDVIVAKK
ncbi:hypothetical protein FNT36_04020 [Hymenobacter setariae]|uniref:Lipocalin-like domain-containing protein n=1 Tax=Hymenobacter setariae TaxID=2594794 RepID=A0A558C377_9BACT|nr:hypothetical protein [Hymenobacter setariae]TVT43265.1 hypothetical protein FNT36_04020 [Hymenobacter setariae]